MAVTSDGTRSSPEIDTITVARCKLSIRSVYRAIVCCGSRSMALLVPGMSALHHVATLAAGKARARSGQAASAHLPTLVHLD
jgi:hypothetical protein